MFDYEELQLIKEMLEMNMAVRSNLIPDTKRGEITYLQAQKSLLNKCYRLMNEDEFHELPATTLYEYSRLGTYFDGMDEDRF